MGKSEWLWSGQKHKKYHIQSQDELVGRDVGGGQDLEEDPSQRTVLFSLAGKLEVKKEEPVQMLETGQV